jgi:phosphatidylcholine synthase
MLRQTAAWAVHLYTAAGAVCALLALEAAVGGRLRAAFAWLAVQVAIDSSDGVLARLASVETVLPHLDGSRLDDIVDYLTYVFVPAAIVVGTPLVPGSAGWVVAAGMLVSSGFGFANAAAKTADHFFTGFPSYWNIVVLYLVAFHATAAVSAMVLAVLAMLVFVPIHYVYPSRTPVLRPLTVTLGLAWAVSMLVAIATLPAVPVPILYGSLVFPAYYVVLSLALQRRRAPVVTKPGTGTRAGAGQAGAR